MLSVYHHQVALTKLCRQDGDIGCAALANNVTCVFLFIFVCFTLHYKHKCPVRVWFNCTIQCCVLYLSLLLSRVMLSVVSKVWQEQTVQRLLQLIELPVLDGVLDCGECPLSAGNSNEADVLYSSNYLDREILKAFKESQ